jgi:hypothetical protein
MKSFTAQFVFKTMHGYRYMKEFHTDKPPKYMAQGLFKVGDTLP